MRSRSFLVFALLLVGGIPRCTYAQSVGDPGSTREVLALLSREPVNAKTWPAWRERLLAWMGEQNKSADPARLEAERLLFNLVDMDGMLPPPYRDDFFAWYLLGESYLDQDPVMSTSPANAEHAFRHSVALKPDYAPAHRDLARALLLRARERTRAPQPQDPGLIEADRQVELARQLDPALPLHGLDGLVARQRGQYDRAIALFEKELRENPAQTWLVTEIAGCELFDAKAHGKRAENLKWLTDRFPKDGVLASFYALSLFLDNRPEAAGAELQRARDLGADPRQVLSPQYVDQIEAAARSGLAGPFLESLLGFLTLCALVIAGMAAFAEVVARLTRGRSALALLPSPPSAQATENNTLPGRPAPNVLVWLYRLILLLSLLSFYALLGIVVFGFLSACAYFGWFIWSAGYVPFWYAVGLFLTGGFTGWALYRWWVMRRTDDALGMHVYPDRVPELYAAVAEAAQRVDAAAPGDIYVMPGSTVTVRQEARGLFGILGVRRRVLIIGFSTLHAVTRGELKALLATEFALFSRQNGWMQRLIYHLELSIEETLDKLLEAGGGVTHLNPLYWLLWLYFQSHLLMAAGYLRAQQFLADRMAALAYGPAQVVGGLTRSHIDGMLYEVGLLEHFAHRTDKRSFVNLFESYEQSANQEVLKDERERLYHGLLTEKAKLFDPHPPIAERIAAVQTLPSAAEPEPGPALELCGDTRVITEGLTRYTADHFSDVPLPHLPLIHQHA
jgi:Zn-dependent protease with chaperone function